MILPDVTTLIATTAEEELQQLMKFVEGVSVLIGLLLNRKKV